MTAYSPAEWSDLFVATAGAAAALAGLVFVAVSINIQRILGYAGLPERALETVALLVGVVIVSFIGLAPGLDQTALGLLLLAESLLLSAGVGRLVASKRSESNMGSRVGLLVPGTLPFVIGAISVLAGSGGGLYWVLAGIIGAIVCAVLNAWVLLVEILR